MTWKPVYDFVKRVPKGRGRSLYGRLACKPCGFGAARERLVEPWALAPRAKASRGIGSLARRDESWCESLWPGSRDGCWKAKEHNSSRAAWTSRATSGRYPARRSDAGKCPHRGECGAEVRARLGMCYR